MNRFETTLDDLKKARDQFGKALFPQADLDKAKAIIDKNQKLDWAKQLETPMDRFKKESAEIMEGLRRGDLKPEQAKDLLAKDFLAQDRPEYRSTTQQSQRFQMGRLSQPDVHNPANAWLEKIFKAQQDTATAAQDLMKKLTANPVQLVLMSAP